MVHNKDERIKRRRALIETMTFFDVFDFALTREELCDYMLYRRWKLNELHNFANHEEFIVETHSHVYFRGRSHTKKVRKEKELRARKLYKKAKRFVKYMQTLPFVRSVSLCNSLSFYDAEKDSDIDLFIITEKNRLFTARAFCWLFTQILGIRRHGDKIKARFCLSFMVSRDSMNLNTIKLKDDIYLLFWIRLLRPLTGQSVYREFIKENSWIRDYFDYEIDQQKHLIGQKKSFVKMQKIFEFPLKNIFGNLVESFFKKIQKRRARKKAEKLQNASGTVISDGMLKFHDIDMRETISSLWKKRYSQFKKYINPAGTYYDIPSLQRYHRSRRLFEFRFQDTAGKKSESHSRR
jgi:hypothetical protein